MNFTEGFAILVTKRERGSIKMIAKHRILTIFCIFAYLLCMVCINTTAFAGESTKFSLYVEDEKPSQEPTKSPAADTANGQNNGTDAKNDKADMNGLKVTDGSAETLSTGKVNTGNDTSAAMSIMLLCMAGGTAVALTVIKNKKESK